MYNATKLRQELDELRVQLTATQADNARLREQIAASEDATVARYATNLVWVRYDLTQKQARQVMVHLANQGDTFQNFDEAVRKAVDVLGLV